MRSRSKFRLDRPASGGTRAILYLRVSSRKQAEKGHSMDAQEAALIAEAERRGITDYVILKDAAESAKSTNRPELQKAFAMLASGERNLIIVGKLDRLARSTMDVLTLAQTTKKEGWNIVVMEGTVRFDTTDPNGKLMLTMMAAMAEWERDMIVQRTLDTNAFRRSRGDEGLISPELEERIVELYKGGLSMDRIAKQLNAEGVPTAKNGSWYASTIKCVIDRARETPAVA